MFNRKSIDLFISKVPDLKKPFKVMLTIVYFLGLAALCTIFFYYMNSLAWYGPILSQLVMAFVVTVIGFVHFRLAANYRKRYGSVAYRFFFYHLMIPYLVTWYACFFHPLFVSGPALLPWWMAIGMTVLLFLLFILSNIHIEKAGFHMVTHGMDVFTVFPEEATLVYGSIYGFIRHPLYFSLTCGCFALALVRNNAVALAVALLQLIPALAIGYMEDKELVERAGVSHQEYINNTGALFPKEDLSGFLRLLFMLDKNR